jgi:DNA-binding SARP family transcriptional activator
VALLHRDVSPVLLAAQLGAEEARIAADLHFGRYDAATLLLERLVREHPLREPLYEQLMTALLAKGRRADALDVYRRARQTLRAELGLDPGPELEAAHGRALADPLTAVPTEEPARASFRPRPGSSPAARGSSTR